MSHNILPAPFFVVEGIDGSGKDALRKKLSNIFSGRIWETQEPTNDATGKEIRQFLEVLQIDGKQKPPYHKLVSLYLKDRFSHSQKIKQKLQTGVVVLSLRYDLSTYAYQAESNKDFENLYVQHAYLKEKTLIPTLTIYLDLNATKAIERIEKRGLPIEFFEKEKSLEKIRNNYLQAIAFLQKKDGRKIISLSAEKPSSILVEEVKSIIEYEIKLFQKNSNI